MIDYVELTKPRLMMLVLLTMTAGMLLVPGSISAWKGILSIAATAGIVGACGCLNMYMERDLDGLMDRTRSRPIPSGKVRARTALLIGFLLLAAAFPLLLVAANGLTAGMAAVATGLYLGIYTPLKTRSHRSVYVGAMAGATPVLIGTSAVTGSLNALGVSLFLILYTWQLQHFLSIALRHDEDYRKAGIKTCSLVLGRNTARLHLVIFCLTFWIAALLPLRVTDAGGIYFIAASTVGLSLLALSLLSRKRPFLPEIDRRLFLGALAALPLLLTVLVADANYLNSYWPRMRVENPGTQYVHPNHHEPEGITQNGLRGADQ